MKVISNFHRVTYLTACAAVGAIVFSSSPKAAVIDLGFALDASGSVGSANFNLVRTALSNALVAIPTSGPDTYRVSVVTFSTTASTVHTAVINSVAARTALQTAVAGATYSGGTTCISCATQLLTNNINSFGNGFGNSSLINITTDGEPNEGTTNGVTLRNATTAAGWDSISAEAIGSFDLTFLQALVFPNPGQTTNNPNALPNPLTQGFVLTLANFAAYEGAIDAKIQNIVDPTPIPGALPLFASGLGAFGYLAWRRKKRVQAAA